MDMDEVHNMLAVFKEVEFDNFKNNFTRLKGCTQKDQGQTPTGLAGYKQDIQVNKFAKDIDKKWHGSESIRVLKNDIDSSLHKHTKPKDLIMTYDEYKKFGLPKLCNHLYPVIRKKRVCLLANQETKKRKEESSKIIRA
eukprot:13047753-Ditylum_brightwellii.AAC.1